MSYINAGSRNLRKATDAVVLDSALSVDGAVPPIPIGPLSEGKFTIQTDRIISVDRITEVYVEQMMIQGALGTPTPAFNLSIEEIDGAQDNTDTTIINTDFITPTRFFTLTQAPVYINTINPGRYTKFQVTVKDVNTPPAPITFNNDDGRIIIRLIFKEVEGFETRTPFATPVRQ